jgi:hypothetical protein
MLAGKIVTGLVLVTLGAAACSDGTGPSPAAGKQSISLSVSSGATGPAGAAADTVSSGGHSLVLGKVELVMRQIRLKRVEGSQACAGDDQGDDAPAASGSDGHDGGNGESDDSCEAVATGPLLLDLPLGGTPQKLVTVTVDTGTYREVDFKLHKPGTGDSDFVKANPDFAQLSIRVTGTFDGHNFSYQSDVTAEQRDALVPALAVTAAGPTNLTLVVDVKTWFVDSKNGQLIDPASGAKGQVNEQLVRDNIRASLRMFEDHDRDGHEDHDH